MRSEPKMKEVANFMPRLAKKVVVGITPPLVTDLIRKMIPSLRVGHTSLKFEKSDRNVRSDQYIQWICYILGGFSSPGNIRAFDHAVRYMPGEGAIVEIGAHFLVSQRM